MKQLDEFDDTNPRLLDFVYAFFKHRKVIGVIVVSFSLVALALTFILDKEYTADVSFVSLSKIRSNDFNGKGGDLAALSVVMATATGSLSATNNAFYLSIVDSNSLKDMIVDELRLDEHYRPKGVKTKLDARGLLKKHIIAKDMKSGLVQIRVTDHDPVMAAKIANLIPIKINQFLNSVNITDAQKHELFLKNRLDLVQAEMRTTRLEREASVKEALYLMLLKEYELARANAAREKLDVQIIDPAEVPLGASFPRLLIFEVVAIALGLIVSIGFVIIRQLWAGLMRDPRNAYLANRMASDISIRNRLPWRRAQ